MEQPLLPAPEASAPAASWRSWLQDFSRGSRSLLRLLKPLEVSDGVSDTSSDASFALVKSGEIPELLEKIKKYVEDGYEDTRVTQLQTDFVEEVVKLPFQLITTHSCVVLGPAGAGKTTLVNHLGGVKFHTGPQAEDKTVEAQSCDAWAGLCFLWICHAIGVGKCM